MNEEILIKILDSDLGREVKEKILTYWLTPPPKSNEEANKAPIQKVSSGRVGSVKRPSREEVDLRKNPKKREEQEAMTETLDKVLPKEK